MKLYLKSVLNGICALSIIAMTGCVPLLIGAAVGVGGITYINGSLAHNIDENVAKTHKAALAALKDLDLFIISDELNKHSASIHAEYADTKKVQVSIEALTEYVSEIRIRVGTFGDQDESNAILNAILINL